MTPETRREFFLDAIAKNSPKLPAPATREEFFIVEIAQRIENLISDFDKYVEKTDFATKESVGLMRPGGGLDVRSSGTVEVAAATNAEISAGINNYKPLVPANLAGAMAVYGIASREYVASLEARITALEKAIFNDI